MFIINLFKFILFLIFVYMLWNLIKFVFLVGRNAAGPSSAPRDRVRAEPRGQGFFRQRRGDRDVIELDKDQYKVE